MSSDFEKKSGAINFNTVVSFVILAVVTWAGASIQANRVDVSKLSGKIDVMEVKLSAADKMSSEHNIVAVDQLQSVRNDLASLRNEVSSQRVMIGQLQIDLARVTSAKNQP